ncbi:Crp/Fnr family transcriptional regulator [Flavobacterium salilacus subsp. salilacus]|uniref:Crp/Fnr family transcriptional regulator n=1 Tax=Flavobacterium TaxID=237 RepID=UPI0010755958|nr:MULTISPECIES: Crp/Fnr family transcriptional regulator [Flavobacterium]KAF2518181.1 Crp/Fnr family transcriptional regulator [Flavobacterium salilacus subsp. salilacus]MBE1615507.1 Crp/Fnr family transcriptional regulator [Flavobacterium sp. SaA2.13]
MFSEILSHIRRFVPLDPEEEALLASLLEVREVKKKEHLLQAGEICKANYFVAKGCFRLYLITTKGAEQVIQFGIEDWWITDYAGLKSGKPSGFYVQAVEPSTVVVLNKEAEEVLFEKIPQLERYFRQVLERAYSAQLTRIHYVFNLTGEEQYKMMRDKYPDFVQRVPQYMLASFLGITPEFLSMLRAKKD